MNGNSDPSAMLSKDFRLRRYRCNSYTSCLSGSCLHHCKAERTVALSESDETSSSTAYVSFTQVDQSDRHLAFKHTLRDVTRSHRRLHVSAGPALTDPSCGALAELLSYIKAEKHPTYHSTDHLPDMNLIS